LVGNCRVGHLQALTTRLRDLLRTSTKQPPTTINCIVNMLVFKTGLRLARPVTPAIMRPRSFTTTIVRADLTSRIASLLSAAQKPVLVTQDGIRQSKSRAIAEMDRDDANHFILALPNLSALDQSTLIPQLGAAVEIVEHQQRLALASLGLRVWRIHDYSVGFYTSPSQSLTSCTGY
jgi:hypothetical protein